MLESLTSLGYGFSIALQPQNLFYCFIGVTMGTLVGVLPGIGPTATIALLLPATFQLSPVAAIIMLSGICYGAMYGGSTTSILLNIPGEASSVITCLDGYQMARQGRAGRALGISAFGSFIAGTVSIFGLILLAPTLANFALRFGPPEYFALMVMGLTVVAYLARKSMAKALMMAVVGIVLGCIGLDPITATPRFTFGMLELADGIGIAPVVMGLFGIAEVLENLGVLTKAEVFAGKIKGLFPDREDWKRSMGPIARGSLLGFFLGLLPGVGAIVPQFLSYALEKKLSRYPERFGNGEIAGVAAPEACNNAAVGGTFIPLLSLGIPSNAMTAILLGALMIYGLTPGPLLITNSPDLFWGVIASMYIGNLMLLILNLPLIPVWVSVLKIPYSYLSAFIILFCLIGAYSLNNSTTDIYIAVFFSLVGLLMKKFEFEGAPLVLAFVLGPLLETALRRSLILSDGSLLIFVQRPLSAAFILFSTVVLVAPLFTKLRLGRGLSEED
ncbi:MAG TPA: tripartite tricarboxylate transporter permease [Candidatus Binatia bacterium]|nr:tripartite tricarboxylate transporter permease [Candidatus Binatia bacterium]